MNGRIQLLKAQGDVKDACQALATLAEQFKGWTFEKLLRYARLTETVKKQFGGEVDAERRY